MKGKRPGITFWERWENISRQYAFKIITEQEFDYGMAGLRLTDRQQALAELEADFAAKHLSEENYESRFLALQDIYAQDDEEWELENCAN